jgi:hypothetical protein
MRLATQARRPARSRGKPPRWPNQPKVRSAIHCTTLPSASVGLIRPTRWWDAEDNLDVQNHQARDVALGRPVQNVEALAHASGEELQLANNQGQGTVVRWSYKNEHDGMKVTAVISEP